VTTPLAKHLLSVSASLLAKPVFSNDESVIALAAAPAAVAFDHTAGSVEGLELRKPKILVTLRKYPFHMFNMREDPSVMSYVAGKAQYSEPERTGGLA
jgi:hypothetical protein